MSSHPLPPPPSVMWFRRDLRLADHPALTAAAKAGPVLCLFVVDERLYGPSGPARADFLVGCLRALDEALEGRLTVVRGDPARLVAAVAEEAGAGSVYVTGDHGPYGAQRDETVGRALAAAGRRLVRVGTAYAVGPGMVRKADGDPYAVFTPFYRAWRQHGWREPLPVPGGLEVREPLRSREWPGPGPHGARLPVAGEDAAHRCLEAFLERVGDYGEARNMPGADGTSRLSPYLKYGCLHPRQALDRLGDGAGDEVFRKELAWREFYADVLGRSPESARWALQERMEALPVDTGKEADRRFAAWAEGRTGYPIVDAGMRQLAGEAWMHNRARMITASFLVKDLHLDWRRGARHFMRLLVDGDLASNQHGWQWVAGTGTDAAPFERVFNPTLQGEKFDPDGAYVRRWVPELRDVPSSHVHQPWAAPGGPPAGYPAPIVDHAAERKDALARYAHVKASRA